MARFDSKVLTVVLAGIFGAPGVWAQTDGGVPALVPGADAGAQATEIRRREQLLLERPTPPMPATLEEIEVLGDSRDLEGPVFELRSVRFSPSELLSEQQLRDIVTPYLGQQVAHSQLMEIVEAVNRSYREQGVYTAVAVLPQQEVQEGVVVIRLIEGRLGAIRFEGNEYTSEAFLARWMEAHRGQETVDMPRLQADILEFNRVNDERIRAELRRGESFGLTDIVVTVQEPERGFFQAFTDNYGYESSGREELGFMYRHQHLLSDGDRSIAYLSGSEGAQSLSLSYNRPLGGSRWRVGGSGSLTRTDLTEGDFATSNVAGDSYRVGLESSWLAWSGEQLWISALGAAGYTRSTTEIAGVVFSDDAITQAQLGVSLNWVGRQWQLSGRQMVSLTDFDDKSDVATARQATRETLFNGGLTGYFRYRDSGLYGLFLSQWQYSDGQQLPGSLSFALGGPTSIRGYLPSAVSGDRGWYGQLEVHYDAWRPWGVAVEPYLFYDYGEASSLDPGDTAGGKLQTPLAAAGLGLSVAGSNWGVTLSAAEAKKEATPNQDGHVFYARMNIRY
ncbi:ShlB/FhaC/HecB family hemolysin secretion/activation protein [Microbulbifer sp. ALW1]|uniref:ShlB/FhaC/HecB family hemolysin secretion/activation protein n=1 Tax=Microbulbifer sp. (strain ALW1) TaxID=1516059 RepID=UPI0013587E68|nr:ShlB/FhaC/HecB family hemolysin secretion/activation protein [Microbulbifer sp. ALW1]